MRRLFRQFSFPGGIPSHVAPETPGSIHEGGELGYSLAHAYGAAFDNPDLLVACVVGDGEAETGPLATSWHSNKFLNPARDGAVLPILHLNGYKIANPTVLARIGADELTELLRGLRLRRRISSRATTRRAMHQAMAATLDDGLDEIAADPARRARADGDAAAALADDRAAHAKGWTGPKMVDGQPVEGTLRAHQVPLADVAGEPRAPAPARRVDAQLPAGGAVRRGRALRAELAALAPDGQAPDGREPARQRRAAAAATLSCPTSATTRSRCPRRRRRSSEATRVLGGFLRD